MCYSHLMPLTRTIQVPVDLIDDNEFEGDEDFNGLLTLVSSLSRVIIAPDNALATIVEDEGISACVIFDGES